MVHDVGRGGAQGGAEVVKIFQVCLVERVPDDFNVEGIEIRGGEALSEVWSYINPDTSQNSDVLCV